MTQSRLLVLLLGILLTVSITAPGIASGTTYQVSVQAYSHEADVRGSNGVTMISECQVITSPGHYRLAKDILNSSNDLCIRVLSSDVVFDGAGHRIDGVNKYLIQEDGEQSSTKGIVVRGEPEEGQIANVTIKNVEVTDYGYGLFVGRTDGSRIVNNTFRSNGIYGLYAGYDAENNTIAGNRVQNIRNENLSDDTMGIFVANDAPGNVVYKNYVKGVGNLGIAAFGSGRSLIQNNRIEDIGDVGVAVGGSPHSVVRGNRIERARIGIRTSFVVNVTIVGNVLTDIDELGVFIRKNATETEVRNNEISGATQGIRLAQNKNNSLLNNTIAGNTIGVLLKDTGEQTLEETTLANNSVHDIKSRELSAPFTVENAVIGTGVRLSLKGKNIDILGTLQIPTELPDRTRAVSNYIKIQPEPDDSWVELKIHFDSSTVATGASIDLWIYSVEWTKHPPSAVNQRQNSLSTNLTDLQDEIYLVVAKTEPKSPTSTPSPMPTTSPNPEPSPTPTPTASPTTGPGQPGFGMVIALVGLFGAMLLAQRFRR